MFQSFPPSPAATATVTAGDTQLNSVGKFCYLGSYLANTITVDSDINSRLAKAVDAFGKLQRRLWSEHSVSLPIKITVYQAVVLSSLLYGCESWVLYQRSLCKLDEFHMRCKRRIAGIKWQDRVPNTEVLHLCGITGIEAFLLQAQFRWVGHVVRMQDDCIPKQILYGQLSSGKRRQCGPVRQGYCQGQFEEVRHTPTFVHRRTHRCTRRCSPCVCVCRPNGSNTSARDLFKSPVLYYSQKMHSGGKWGLAEAPEANTERVMPW